MWLQHLTLLLAGLSMIAANPLTRQVGLSEDVGVTTYNNTEDPVEASEALEQEVPSVIHGEAAQVEQSTELNPEASLVDKSGTVQEIITAEIIPEPSVSEKPEGSQLEQEVLPNNTQDTTEDVLSEPIEAVVQLDTTKEEEKQAEESSNVGQEISPAEILSEATVAEVEVSASAQETLPITTQETKVDVHPEPSVSAVHLETTKEEHTQVEDISSTTQDTSPTDILPEPSLANENPEKVSSLEEEVLPTNTQETNVEVLSEPSVAVINSETTQEEQQPETEAEPVVAEQKLEGQTQEHAETIVESSPQDNNEASQAEEIAINISEASLADEQNEQGLNEQVQVLVESNDAQELPHTSQEQQLEIAEIPSGEDQNTKSVAEASQTDTQEVINIDENPPVPAEPSVEQQTGSVEIQKEQEVTVEASQSVIESQAIQTEQQAIQTEQQTELIPEPSVAEQQELSQEQQQPTVIPEPSVAEDKVAQAEHVDKTQANQENSQAETIEASVIEELSEVGTEPPQENTVVEASEAESHTTVNAVHSQKVTQTFDNADQNIEHTPVSIESNQQPDLLSEASEAHITTVEQQINTNINEHQEGAITEASVSDQEAAEKVHEEQTELYPEALNTHGDFENSQSTVNSEVIPETAQTIEHMELTEASKSPAHSHVESEHQTVEAQNTEVLNQEEPTVIVIEAAEEQTDAPIEAIEEHTDAPIEALEEQTDITVEVKAVEEQTGITIEAAEEHTQVPIEAAEEHTEVPIEAAEEHTEVPIEAAEEHTEVPIEAAEEHAQVSIEIAEEHTVAPIEAVEELTDAPVEAAKIQLSGFDDNAELPSTDTSNQEPTHIDEISPPEASTADVEPSVDVNINKNEELEIKEPVTGGPIEAIEAEQQTSFPPEAAEAQTGEIVEEAEIQTEANIAADTVEKLRTEVLVEAAQFQTDVNIDTVESETEIPIGTTKASTDIVIEAVEESITAEETVGDHTDAVIEAAEVQTTPEIEAVETHTVADVEATKAQTVAEIKTGEAQTVTEIENNEKNVAETEAAEVQTVTKNEAAEAQAVAESIIDSITEAAEEQTDVPTNNHQGETSQRETSGDATVDNEEQTEPFSMFQESSTTTEPVGSVIVSINGNGFVKISETFDAPKEQVTNKDIIVTESANAEELTNPQYWQTMNQEANQNKNDQGVQEESDDQVEKEFQKVAQKYGLKTTGQSTSDSSHEEDAISSKVSEEGKLQVNELRKKRGFVDRVARYVGTFF